MAHRWLRHFGLLIVVMLVWSLWRSTTHTHHHHTVQRYHIVEPTPSLSTSRLALVSTRMEKGKMMTDANVAGSVAHTVGCTAGCDWSRRDGGWVVKGVVGEEEGSPEHILHFNPVPQRNNSRCTSFTRFDSRDAWQCLSGKHIVMYGNSNTRTLYIALEALLRDKPMTSRVAAKQMCDNSRTNHSCWATIEDTAVEAGQQGDSGGTRTRMRRKDPVQLHYVSYTGDLYHEKLLDERLRQVPMVRDGDVDFVIGNSGLNTIQLQDDHVLLGNHKLNAPKLRDFVQSLNVPHRLRNVTFVWHTTTPVCPNQPHFRRYRYNAKHWRHRTLDQINEVIVKSNRIALSAFGDTEGVVPSSPSSGRLPVVILDGWRMVHAATGAGGEGKPLDLCPYFEDPLHHRFLDRELVQMFLNEVCCYGGSS